MCPRAIAQNIYNSAGLDAILQRQVFVPLHRVRMTFANCLHVLLCELCAVMRLTPLSFFWKSVRPVVFTAIAFRMLVNGTAFARRTSALFHHVFTVLLRCALENMGTSNARRVVARMADKKWIRIVAVMQHKANPSCHDSNTEKLELTVSGLKT